MARDDDWGEDRRWDQDRDYGDPRRPDFRTTGDYRYDARDDRYRPGYRAAREDAWMDDRRRDEARREAQRERSERAYQPFGSTGPTAYGPYYDSPYAWGQGYMPYGLAAPYAGAGGAYGSARTDYGSGGYRSSQYPPSQGARPNEGRSFLDRAADQVASWFGDHDAERRRQEDELASSHRGRGPKGYKRADSRIQEDINDRLTEDPYIDATYIEVSVTDGEVTLSGLVNSREDKRRAERLAEQVSGVGDVQNTLRLRRPETGETGERPSGTL